MTQPPFLWPDDAGAVIAEMKRLATVRTDQQLAHFMGAAQSTVSNWRKRGAVPEAAIRQFEIALEGPRPEQMERNFAARAIAMRIPEVWFQQMREKDIPAGRYLPYLSVATTLNAIVAEIEEQMQRIEVESGLATRELCSRLLDDDKFLTAIIDWLRAAPASEMLARELRATRRSHLDQ